MTSIGLFTSVDSPSPEQWRRSLEAALALEPDHIEVMLASMPRTTWERAQFVSMFGNIGPIAIHAPHLNMSLATDWPDLATVTLDRTRYAIDLANEVGAKVLTVHSGFVPASLSDTDRDTIDRIAQRLDLLAAESNCPLSLENSELATTRAIKDLGSFATLRAVRESCSKQIFFTVDVDPEDFEQTGVGSEMAAFLAEESKSIADVHLHMDADMPSAAIDDLAAVLRGQHYAGLITIQAPSAHAADRLAVIRDAFDSGHRIVHRRSSTATA